MNTIKTTLHVYYFNCSKADESKAYHELFNRLLISHKKCFNVYAERGKELFPMESQSLPIELETKFLFDNQWNSVCGKRLFDWYEGIYPNRAIKFGHYLEITNEMKAIRKQTLVCGYCGEKYGESRTEKPIDIEESLFCSKCLNSPYLKSAELHLLRLFPVADSFNAKRKPINEAEKAVLLPKYKEAQIYGREQRKQNYFKTTEAETIQKYNEAIAEAETTKKGMLWLLQHKIPIENVIFYPNQGNFCFGWYQDIDDIVKEEMKAILAEFPFSWYFKEKK